MEKILKSSNYSKFDSNNPNSNDDKHRQNNEDSLRVMFHSILKSAVAERKRVKSV